MSVIIQPLKVPDLVCGLGQPRQAESAFADARRKIDCLHLGRGKRPVVNVHLVEVPEKAVLEIVTPSTERHVIIEFKRGGVSWRRIWRAFQEEHHVRAPFGQSQVMPIRIADLKRGVDGADTHLSKEGLSIVRQAEGISSGAVTKNLTTAAGV